MSASIYYQAVKGKNLPVGAPQAFLKILREIKNGELPLHFTEYDVRDLRLAAKLSDNEEFKECLNELADACEKHESVNVWAEY